MRRSVLSANVECAREWAFGSREMARSQGTMCAVRRPTASAAVGSDDTGFFTQKWNQLLARLREYPSRAMLCYMSDGWSTWRWHVRRSQDGPKVTSTWSRERSEYLLQRAVLKIQQPSGTVGAIMFEAPRPMFRG